MQAFFWGRENRRTGTQEQDRPVYPQWRNAPPFEIDLLLAVGVSNTLAEVALNIGVTAPISALWESPPARHLVDLFVHRRHRKT